MNQAQQQKLNNLIGKTITYEGKEYNIIEYKDKHGNVIIFSKERTFNFLTSDLDLFLDSVYLPVAETEQGISYIDKMSTRAAEVPTVEKAYKTSLEIYEPTESQKAVNKTLLEMMAKVKEDPGTIAQAKAICEI